MRALIAVVILAAAIAGVITLLTEWSFNEILQWIILWIRNEDNRLLLTAITAVLGILGWGWSVILWVGKRDATAQLEELQRKLDRLPDMMTRMVTPYFHALIIPLMTKLSPEEQRDVFAKLQEATKAIEDHDQLVVGRVVIREKRSPFGLEEARIDLEQAWNPFKAEGKQLLLQNSINLIVRDAVNRSLTQVGIAT
jgi:hypothetical protein